MTKHVCIVGSGPSGFFAADHLLRKLPTARIDIIDRLPTPYGLLRGGVAPDHQGTKNIARQYERTCQKDNVRFLGNVMVGRDVSYGELKAAYDAVILAIGAPADRKLGIPGEELEGVYGSGAFVGWYNGHPDFRDLAPRLDGSAVAVIGNGNVALDIARILAKTPAEMAASDLCAHAQADIDAARLTDIYVLGRRGPIEASFTFAELAEMGELERAEPVVDAAALPEAIEPDPSYDLKVKQKNLDILKDFAGRAPAGKPIKVHFLFNAAPKAIRGHGKVEALQVERTRVEGGRAVLTGETFELPVCAVVSAIGYRSEGFAGLPMDEARGTVRNEAGRVEPGVYVVGWSKRGPTGTVPTNRQDSIAVADLALADMAAAGETAKAGGAEIDRLLGDRGVRSVCFTDWQKINEAEAGRAAPGRPREKFTRVGEMLAVLE